MNRSQATLVNCVCHVQLPIPNRHTLVSSGLICTQVHSKCALMACPVKTAVPEEGTIKDCRQKAAETKLNADDIILLGLCWCRKERRSWTRKRNRKSKNTVWSFTFNWCHCYWQQKSFPTTGSTYLRKYPVFAVVDWLLILWRRRRIRKQAVIVRKRAESITLRWVHCNYRKSTKRQKEMYCHWCRHVMSLSYKVPL